MQRAKTQDSSIYDAAAAGGLEVARDALRKEFQALQDKLLEAVRSEISDATCRESWSFPHGLKKKKSSAMNSEPSVRTPESRYLPMKPYKVAEYKRWLEEVDEVVDQGLPTPATDGRAEVHFATLASTAKTSRDTTVHDVRTSRDATVHDTKCKDLAEEADVLKHASMSPCAPDRPVLPMMAHPWSPQHESEADDDDKASSVSKKTDDPTSPKKVEAIARQAEEASPDQLVRTYSTVAQCPKQGVAHKLERIVRNPKFELVSMIMIFASAMHIGWQTDHMARNMLLTPPTVFRIFDVAFLVFFVFELILRLAVYRVRYFHMWGWQWNVLDLGLIAMQILEEVVLAVDPKATGGFSSQLLRIVRILRAVRVIRIVHAMHFAEELRLLVNCVAHSSRSFHWAAALILLMVYVMGVHLAQIALVESAEDAPEKEELQRWYGNVPRSVLSLFQGLTGGVDWNDLILPLMSVSPWFGLMFVLFMAFAIISVMNVVTGTFVQQAVERAEHVNEVRKVSQASNLFRTLDVHREGFITFDEIEAHMETDAVKDFFQSIDLDLSEARCLFDMLDADNSGKINFEEFLGGCMRLQGPAKAIDLVMFMREMKDDLRRLFHSSGLEKLL